MGNPSAMACRQMARQMACLCTVIVVSSSIAPPTDVVLNFTALALLEEEGGAASEVTVHYTATHHPDSGKRRLEQHTIPPIQAQVYLSRYDLKRQYTIYGTLCFFGGLNFSQALPLPPTAEFIGNETVFGHNCQHWRSSPKPFESEVGLVETRMARSSQCESAIVR